VRFITYSICSERNSATVYVVAKRYDWEWGADAGSVRHGGWRRFRSPSAAAAACAPGRRFWDRHRFRLPSAAAAASAPARRPGRGRQAAPSALPGPAPAPPAAARFPRSRPLPRGPAAIRSCSPRPFADVLSAHPGIAPSLGGPGWRFPPLLLFFSLCCFFMAGTTAPELQASPLLRMKKMNVQAGRGAPSAAPGAA